MVNRFETFFAAYYAYFTAELHQLKKTLGQFENLVFVIMSTRENIRLIARTSLNFLMNDLHVIIMQFAVTEFISTVSSEIFARVLFSRNENL